MRRRVHETIALDQSLRQSRMIWASVAALVFIPAVYGVVSFLAGLTALLAGPAQSGFSSGEALWAMFWGATLALTDSACFFRVAEANRRLRALRSDPNAPVKPLPAPFQASIFGPYH